MECSPAPASARSGELVGAQGTFRFRRRGGEEAASLASLLGPRPAIDPNGLAAAADMRTPSVPAQTLWRDVEARYAEEAPAARDGEVSPPRQADDAPRFLREVLDRTLDRLLAGKRRVGVMAGGGVDSSALLAVAVAWAKRTGGSAFGVALDYAADGDDRPYLRGVEARLGVEIVRVAPEDAARWMPLVLGGVDAAPFTWFTGPCEVEMLARARAHGAECVLMGVGGDELFDGEPRSLSRVVRRGHPLEALGDASRMQGFWRPGSPVLSWLVRPLLVGYVPRRVRVARARRGMTEAPYWVGPTLRAHLDAQARALAERGYGRPDTGEARFDDVASRPHRAAIAWLRYQEEIAAGIKRIDPYLDRDLVRAVTSLPPEWLIRGARRRGLLRDAVPELPASTRERMDKASFEPAVERFIAAAGGLARFRPFTRGEWLASHGLVEPRAFAAAAEAFLEHPPGEDWLTVWPALACEAFLASRAGARERAA